MITLDNDIQEQRVSFDNAKLLKEKGFDVPCINSFEIALKSKKNKQDGYSGPFGWKKGEFNIQNGYNRNSSLNKNYDNIYWFGCSLPTHQVAIDWILINFGIYIYVNEEFRPHIIKDKKNLIYTGQLYRLKNDDKSYDWPTPEEANDAAINYVLTKLI